MLDSAVALLGILSLAERYRVPSAAIDSDWTAQCCAGQQIRFGLIGFDGILPAIAAAVSFQFLRYPSHHGLTVCRRKLDVDRQPHTVRQWLHGFGIVISFKLKEPET